MSMDFTVRCVRPPDGCETEASALNEAFNLLGDNNFSPTWISQEECLLVDKQVKNCYYVMDPFDGPAFKHLKHLGCRIFGPQCIMSSLLMKVEIPCKKQPVYNVAMKDVVVSCTSLDKETRDVVHLLVEQMGGDVRSSLTTDVTHLIAGGVGSQKYMVACRQGMQVMMAEWVQAVWEKAKHGHIHAKDEQFSRFRCPVFKGLVVSVSGLDAEERKNVKHYVESEGGKYSGELKLSECTHLIVKEAKGNKYEHARKWNIHIVSLKWLHDSLDSNFCQAEQDYVVKPGTIATDVRTSTPERTRRSALAPNIADISAISACTTHVNDTALQATRFTDTSTDSFDALDLTSVPAEPFLDGCKIYLSGVSGAVLEKLRRIINTGGGTRFSAVTECVTHIVMGDHCEADLNAVKQMEHRPFVVKPSWLAESFRKGQRLPVDAFLSPYVLPSEQSLSKGNFPQRKSSSMGGRNSLPSTEDASERVVMANGHADNNNDMAELLSQYLNTGSKGGDATPCQLADEVDGDVACVHVDEGGGDGRDADMTQDPESETPAPEAGIFGGKTFIFCGFTDENTSVLAQLVTEAGGHSLGKHRGRQVPDFAVVPVHGNLVEKTVSEVVTDAWLQMCLESQTWLPVDSNPIFQPLSIDASSRPLENCVLSISGYVGVERDCLNHIADLLGAVCQEYFVRKARKNLQVSTHLIVKEATGSKFKAAKEWGVPAVAKEWLFACADSGKKENEQRFFVEGMQAPTPKATANSKPSVLPQQDLKSADGARSDMCKRQSSTKTVDQSMTNKIFLKQTTQLVSCSSGLGQNSGVKRDMVAKETLASTGIHQTREKVKATAPADARGSTPLQMSVVVEQKKVMDKARARLSSPMATRSVSHKNVSQLSQKENVGATVTVRGMGSPLKERAVAIPGRGKMAVAHTAGVQATHSRVDELQQQGQKAVMSPGSESPHTYLAPGYQPKFDLTGVLDFYKTPEGRRESLPLEDLVSKCLMEGVKNTASSRFVESPASSSQQYQCEQRGPLDGVIIAVSKKLAAHQTEYNSIVVELGGDYSWQYSASCTHFVFQGRANDANKELRLAKNQGKIIVSPHWLYACKDQNSHIDEGLYPHNYNPNLTLGSVVTKDTPSRATRRSTRQTPKATPKIAGGSAQQLDPQRETAWHESMKEMSSWQGCAKDVGSDGAVGGTVAVADLGLEKPDVDADGARHGAADEENKTPILDRMSTEKTDDEQVKESSTGGSLDVREALGQTVETLKNTSKSKRSSKKRSKRVDGSSGGQMNVSGNVSSNVSDNGHQASPWLQPHALADLHVLQMDSHVPEASQSIQITWDDPIGRQEEEKLADQLDHARSHTQNTEDFMAQMVMPDLDATASNSSYSIKNKQTSTRHQPQVGQSPAPAPPAVAIPTSKVVAEGGLQPIEISDGESQESSFIQGPPAPPIVLISGMPQQEREEYGALIEQLGGHVLDRQHFDPECTHLVIGQPSRNEKFLAAVATGRWVLHKSYFIACQMEQKFVREEDHEWGGAATASLLQTLSAQTQKLAAAACMWRQKVQQMKKKNPSCKGAYQDWTVVLLTDRTKEDNFRRLLSAGGATVLNVRPPLRKDLRATHAFVDFNKVKLSQEDLEILATRVTHCLKPEYIAAHLTDDPECSISEYKLPEVSNTFADSMPDPAQRKRQLQDNEVRDRRKRTRR